MAESVQFENEHPLAEKMQALNLEFLHLAQKLLDHDFQDGLRRLGVDEPTGRELAKMSAGQIANVAKSPFLLAQLRFPSQIVWEAFADGETPHRMARALIVGSALEARESKQQATKGRQ